MYIHIHKLQQKQDIHEHTYLCIALSLLYALRSINGDSTYVHTCTQQPHTLALRQPNSHCISQSLHTCVCNYIRNIHTYVYNHYIHTYIPLPYVHFSYVDCQYLIGSIKFVKTEVKEKLSRDLQSKTTHPLFPRIQTLFPDYFNKNLDITRFLTTCCNWQALLTKMHGILNMCTLQPPDHKKINKLRSDDHATCEDLEL